MIIKKDNSIDTSPQKVEVESDGKKKVIAIILMC